MENPAIFFILRHGETVFNQKGLLQGHLNSPLSDHGKKQMEEAATVLSGISFDVIICSDLGRAIESAGIIAQKVDVPVITDSRLRERNLGIAQGLSLSQFCNQYPEPFELFSRGDPDFVVPEGESIRQRYERSIAFFEAVAESNEGKKIIVVTHGGVLDGVFRRILGIPLIQQRRFSLCNASINTVEIFKKEWKLLNWGYTAHLEQIGLTTDWYKGVI